MKMVEKIGQGVILETPRQDVIDDARQEKLEKLRARLDASKWTLGFGVALLFFGGLNTMLAVGGAVMVPLGVVGTWFWSLQIKRLEGDPWDPDPEIDAWEEDQYQ